METRLAELDAAQQQLVDAEMALGCEVEAVIQDPGLSDEERHMVVRRLYWGFGEDIRAGVVARSVGMKCGPAFLDYVGPRWMPWCPCGGLTPVASRAAFYHGPTRMHRCDDCSREEARRQQEDDRRARELLSLKRMPYGEYLRTDHWGRIRASATSAAGGRCQVCNSQRRIEVHHRTYDRRGEEHPSDLTVLCSGCHSKFHEDGAMPNGD